VDLTASVHKIFANIGKSETETLVTIREASEEESIAEHGCLKKFKFTTTEKHKTGEKQSQEQAHNFL
jgi:hypothetical protein